ncbi:MAG: hypothetical protein DRO10_00860 [Thermoprotei archaeon]|nr:MAG: hypothetical protein DRO10_00860 [Thermoprotei archaeon]
MIEVVSFDVWNTLLDLQYFYEVIGEVLSRKFVKMSQDKIVEKIREKHNLLKKLKIEGKVEDSDIVEYSLKELSKGFGITVEDLTSAINTAMDEVDPNRLVIGGVRTVLERLRVSGVKMGILGNVLFWHSGVTKNLLMRGDILKFFQVSFFADEIGFSKPDPRAFAKVSETFNVAPDKIAHVGDSLREDVGGALISGLVAVGILKEFKENVRIEGQLYIVNSIAEVPEIILSLR